MKKAHIIYVVIIAIISLFLFQKCNANRALNDEIERQHNNILAMTDTIKQYKDELGRVVFEKHAYQLTQEEFRDTVKLPNKKHVDYVTYTNTQLGVRDTIYQTAYIDRTIRDTIYLDNGIISLSRSDKFGNSSRELDISIPYFVDSLLHAGEANIKLNQNIFVESWIERNSKNGETMVYLRSDYPNLNFNSGMGIVATTSPNYEMSMRRTKGWGLNIGPQVGISYDFINRKI